MAWSVLIATWFLVVWYIPLLPDTVATHYGLDGSPDAWGSKKHLWVIAVVSLVLVVGLMRLSRFPYIFNLPISITKENALFQYRLAARLVRFIALVVSSIFFFIVYDTIQSGLGQKAEKLPIWLILVDMCLIFIPLMVYLVLASRGNK